MIEASAVHKSFGNNVAVDGISMSVAGGEVVGLVGANGAGKTTFVRMLLGLLPVTSGRITILDRPPGEADRAQVGYVPQGLGLYRDLTVEQNASFVARSFGVERPRLDPDLAAVAGRPVGEISLGLQRRLAFLVMLSHSPRVLILDEPTSGVGPLGRIALWESIRAESEKGAAVLVTTHYMDEAEQCDRVLMLAQGREVATGTVAEIIKGRISSAVSGATTTTIAALDDAGMVAIPEGPRWRVPGVAATRVREVVGAGIGVEEIPMSFEEAFLDLSE